MQPLTLILTAALLAAVIYAVVAGGPAERRGALVTLVGGGAAMLAARLLPGVDPFIPIYVTDVAMGAVFLILAIRHAKLWLGAAMLLQAADLGLHSAWLLGGEGERLIKPHPYFLGVNLVSWGMVFLLAGATAFAQRRRNRSPDVDRSRPAADDMADVWAPVG